MPQVGPVTVGVMRGRQGLTIPGRDGEDGEDPLIIPGTRGIDGVIGRDGAPGPIGQGLTGEDGDDGLIIPVVASVTGAFGFVIDGTGAVISTGIKGDLTVPFPCTITDWSILADQSGSIVIDIWKDIYANYPPTVADSIINTGAGGIKPTISTATKGTMANLTGWTTTISAGDTLRFNVDSITSIKRATITLTVRRLS